MPLQLGTVSTLKIKKLGGVKPPIVAMPLQLGTVSTGNHIHINRNLFLCRNALTTRDSFNGWKSLQRSSDKRSLSQCPYNSGQFQLTGSVLTATTLSGRNALTTRDSFNYSSLEPRLGQPFGSQCPYNSGQFQPQPKTSPVDPSGSTSQCPYNSGQFQLPLSRP